MAAGGNTMDGLLFLSALIATGIVVAWAITADSRATHDALSKANAGHRASLRGLHHEAQVPYGKLQKKTTRPGFRRTTL